MRRLPKYIYRTVILIALLLALAACGNTSEDSGSGYTPPTANELEYEINVTETAYTITGMGSHVGGELYIPETHNGLPVTEIADGAFLNCYALTAVYIPSSIKRVGDCAFYQCNNIKTLSLIGGGTIICSNAFFGCVGVEEIFYGIEDSHHIYDTAFVGVGESASQNEAGNGTVRLTVGREVKRLSSAFKGVPITDLIFEEDSQIEAIDDYAFADTRISEAILPSGLLTLGEGAFSSNGYLQKVKIPTRITIVKQDTFKDCENLTDVTFADGSLVEIIEDGAFENCGIRSVTLPDGILEIGAGAFKASRLEELSLPNSMRTLKDSAFEGCNSLTAVSVGNGLSVIPRNAFSSCTKLQSLTLGNSIKTISAGAFSDTAVKDLTLPSSVTFIGSNAFYPCGMENLFFESPELWIYSHAGGATPRVEDVYDSKRMATWLCDTYADSNWTTDSDADRIFTLTDASVGVSVMTKYNFYGEAYFKIDLPYPTFYTVTATSDSVFVYDGDWQPVAVLNSGEAFALTDGTKYLKVCGKTFERVDLLADIRGAEISLGSSVIISGNDNTVFSFTPTETENYTVFTAGDQNNTMTAELSLRKLEHGVWQEIASSAEEKLPTLTARLTEGEKVYLFVTLKNCNDEAFVLSVDYADESLRASAPKQADLQTKLYLQLSDSANEQIIFSPDRSGNYVIRIYLFKNERVTAKIQDGEGLTVDGIEFKCDSYAGKWCANEIALTEGKRYTVTLTYDCVDRSGIVYFVIDRAYSSVTAGVAEVGGEFKQTAQLEAGKTYRWAMFGDGELLFGSNADITTDCIELGDRAFKLKDSYDDEELKGDGEAYICFLRIYRYPTSGAPEQSATLNLTVK